MIIRSQDKYSLVNCNHIFMYQNIKLGKAVIASNDNPDLILGLYSTKEKALKVLDMIQECIESNEHIKHVRHDYVYGSYKEVKVFQMPKDDEVLEDEKINKKK